MVGSGSIDPAIAYASDAETSVLLPSGRFRLLSHRCSPAARVPTSCPCLTWVQWSDLRPPGDDHPGPPPGPQPAPALRRSPPPEIDGGPGPVDPAAHSKISFLISCTCAWSCFSYRSICQGKTPGRHWDRRRIYTEIWGSRALLLVRSYVRDRAMMPRAYARHQISAGSISPRNMWVSGLLALAIYTYVSIMFSRCVLLRGSFIFPPVSGGCVRPRTRLQTLGGREGLRGQSTMTRWPNSVSKYMHACMHACSIISKLNVYVTI
jgi:hypothetical protein